MIIIIVDGIVYFLEVPNDCAIRVGHETKNWEEGKCLVFDDTLEHEVWNHGNIPRIILLIDFKKSNF
ncbi:putative hydroxylase [Nostoc commune NIES-4072]|uniref:Putative hydroxylase n=1 Tax=Nostoc commune NIES-4072 TaxID=2005467 RepID=A0A2R5FJ64_NOSCO|nr:aspartyl/asparaginyl beta-hydroxylase domain-containing protein [Nostoc commune]BBD63887.1 putative hydroxylase [Nostoc commune HK-02]GBG18792.1 putative hydroxylase [Nostoc commune NIES-4072]